jgi:hypothetical protein
MGSKRRVCLVTLAAVALGVVGCGGTVYELRPVPRATGTDAPLTAQVRQVEWIRDLDAEGLVAVVIDAQNGDPARTFTLEPPRLLAKSTAGGAAFELELSSVLAIDDASPDRATYQKIGAKPRQPLAPGATRTMRATFQARGEPPRGPLGLVAVVPVEGAAPLELGLALPGAEGPRWQTPRPVSGLYLRGGYASLGRGNGVFYALEPVAFAFRSSFGRWVTSADLRFTFLAREGGSAPGTSQGFSGLLGLAFEPWHGMLAPYVEAGAYGGAGAAPMTIGGVRYVGAGRVSAGVLVFAARRLEAQATLPVDRPLSPQRAFGLRAGYTRWFYSGASSGTPGFELSYEVGFGR